GNAQSRRENEATRHDRRLTRDLAVGREGHAGHGERQRDRDGPRAQRGRELERRLADERDRRAADHAGAPGVPFERERGERGDRDDVEREGTERGRAPPRDEPERAAEEMDRAALALGAAPLEA